MEHFVGGDEVTKTEKSNLVMRRKGYKHLSTDCTNSVKSKMPIAKRRSVTIDQFVWDAINDLRAVAIKSGFDLNFTTALNLMAEYGIIKMQESLDKEDTDPKLLQVADRYLNYSELREHGILDDWKDFQEFREWKETRKNEKLMIEEKVNELPR